MTAGPFLKKDIPQPKYKIGEAIVFRKPLGEEKQKGVGIVEHILISMTATTKQIMYKVEDRESAIDESEIEKRIIL